MRLKGMSEIQVNDAHIWVVTRHQYEISAVVLQTSYFAGKTVGVCLMVGGRGFMMSRVGKIILREIHSGVRGN